jgi:L-ribulose-5-phosphate 3-epimerase
MDVTRRQFIAKSISSGVLLSTGLAASANSTDLFTTRTETISPQQPSYPISVFSKMLHWLDYSEMAKFARELGFDGVDLTVRPNGHVLPERVVEDLPKVFGILQKAGLNVYMITTAVSHADEPYTEAILKTASSLGIKHYRMNWIDYDNKISVQDNLGKIEKQLSKLAQLNGKYKIIGEYQNHSGANFGSPVWDLHSVLKKINSPWLGSQYDVYHAKVESANSWPLGLELLRPYIRTLVFKDFIWDYKDGKQITKNVPLGDGIIDYKKYLAIIKDYKINVPISLHYEYDLGGAGQGLKEITMSREKVFELMKRDVDLLKGWMKTM